VPDRDIADPEETGRGDTILVSLPPPEGSAVASALRERGFIVIEAPLHLLAVRALAETPRVMIVDVDVPGAVEAIDRTREVTAADLVCVGDLARAAELGATEAEERAFERPLDVEALVTSLLGEADQVAPRSRATLPPGEGRPRETGRPRGRDSDAPHPSDYPSSGSDSLDEGALLPTLDEEEGSAIFAPISISPELSRILENAEQRVSAEGWSNVESAPPPAEEVDLLLPPSLLASLDEPLDPDDDGSASGPSTGGTSALKPRPSGETGASTGAFLEKVTGESTRVGRASGHPTAAGMGPMSGAMPPFGAPPSRSGPLSEGPADDLSAPAEPPAPAMDPRPLRIGVVPIPVESLPDRPIPDSATPATAAESHRPPPPAAMEDLPRPQAAAAPHSIAMADAPRHSIAMADAPGHSIAMADAFKPAAPAPSRPRVEARPEPPRPAPPEVAIPAVLGDGDTVRALSAAIGGRVSGSLAITASASSASSSDFGSEATTRRVVLHEGDIVTAASSAADETLIAFLVARGDLERDVGARLQSRLPAHGRHAGAALIAHGHLGQDDLWPVLRAHAEWILGRTLLSDEGTCELEAEPPGRLKAEPGVFGGATGAEVVLEVIRRVIPPDVARRRLGGATARLAEGPRRQLLVECALRPEDEQIVRSAAGRSVGEILSEAEPELSDVLYGLVSLGVLEALAPTAPAEAAPSAVDPLDEEALRQRVRARVALVEDGDYFSLLGVPRSATSYEIRRAYLELRRAFEPGRVLTAATADLAADVRLVAEVLDEAYDILREPHRRDRYRRAIEAGPP
jgi:hypothetical protein